jgi:Tfp pilus assembly protein PilO
MLRSFNLDYSIWPLNNAGAIARLLLAVLLLGNLVAAYFVLRPPGGSPQELREQLQDLRSQVNQRRALLDRTRVLAGKIEAGRSQGEKFLVQYFLPRRTAYSTILDELSDAAQKSKVHPKESSFGTEPVDGSDNFSLMQISANFEGKYEDLLQFVNLLDKSSRLLIIESLNATPEQGSNLLNVNVKLDTFVTEGAPAP